MRDQTKIIKEIYQQINQPNVFKFKQFESFGYGEIGLSWFNLLYEKHISKNHYEIENQLIEKILALIQEKEDLPPNLNYGLAGLTVLLNSINNENAYFDEEEFLIDIYEILSVGCVNYIKDNNFDFFGGAIGILNILLSANKRIPKLISPHLEKIIEIIITQKISLHTIKSEYEMKLDKYGETIFDKTLNYNNGLAHGLPSIILVLSKLQNTIPNDYIKSLIYDLLNIIFNYKNPNVNEKEELFLENIYFEKENNYRCRLAWCYSDLSLGWALLKTGKYLNDESIIGIAEETIEHTIKLEQSQHLLQKTKLICLCHGSAGNAYIYQRIFEETGNKKYKETAELWERNAITNYENGEIFFDPLLNEFTPNFSVMDGLTGFGLYLIARKFPESQSWNTFMLLD